MEYNDHFKHVFRPLRVTGRELQTKERKDSFKVLDFVVDVEGAKIVTVVAK